MPDHEHPVLVRNLLFAAHCVSLAEVLAAVFASADIPLRYDVLVFSTWFPLSIALWHCRRRWQNAWTLGLFCGAHGLLSLYALWYLHRHGLFPALAPAAVLAACKAALLIFACRRACRHGDPVS